MLQQLAQCITLKKCDGLIQLLPSGGSILAGVAIVLVVLVTPMLREKLLAWLKRSWQAMLALTCGAVGFLIDGHISTFLVAMLTALICLLALNTRVAAALGHRLNNLPGIQKLPRLTISNFVLVSGIVVYLLTNTGLRIHKTHMSEQFAILDDDILVVFALPVLDNSGATTSVKYSAEIKSFEWLLFDGLRGTVAATFKGVDKESDVVPEDVEEQGYAGLKSEFPSYLEHPSTLKDRLDAYRKGSASPVDLVLLTIFTFVPDQNRLRCRFRLYELKSDSIDLERVNWKAEINILPDEIQRATLIASTKLAMHVADRNFHSIKGEEKHLWDALVARFRKYYDFQDNYHDQREQGWAGHALWKDSQCQGRECVSAWMQAYSPGEIQPDAMAEERMDSNARRTILPIKVIANEGTDS